MTDRLTIWQNTNARDRWTVSLVTGASSTVLRSFPHDNRAAAIDFAEVEAERRNLPIESIGRPG